MTWYLLAGLTLGIQAGMTPGPLMALVVTESLRGGARRGVQVAMAPLLTDTYMIVLSLWLVGHLPPLLTGAISVAGGLVVIWFAWDTARAAHHPQAMAEVVPAAAEQAWYRRLPAPALWRGVITNVFNAHAYLWWLLVGGPLVAGALRLGWLPPAAFLAGFFATLVGSKVALALAIGHGRTWLSGPIYARLLLACGAAMAVLGGWITWQGIDQVFSLL